MTRYSSDRGRRRPHGGLILRRSDTHMTFEELRQLEGDELKRALRSYLQPWVDSADDTQSRIDSIERYVTSGEFEDSGAMTLKFASPLGEEATVHFAPPFRGDPSSLGFKLPASYAR